MPDYKHDLHAVHKKPDEKPKVLHIDIETKSSAEISKSGVRRYVEDKDFAILYCMPMLSMTSRSPLLISHAAKNSRTG